LKPLAASSPMERSAVAPRAGAWIETNIPGLKTGKIVGRPPRGGVD